MDLLHSRFRYCTRRTLRVGAISLFAAVTGCGGGGGAEMEAGLRSPAISVPGQTDGSSGGMIPPQTASSPSAFVATPSDAATPDAQPSDSTTPTLQLPIPNPRTPIPPIEHSEPPAVTTLGNAASATVAALSQGWLTVNNPWTQADLDRLDIRTPVNSNGVNQPSGRVGRYTTTVSQYRAKRRQCEEDSNTQHSNGEPKCYPTLQPAQIAFNGRYGYYCGASFPPVAPFRTETSAQTGMVSDIGPAPMDGVDYCCRLHDAQVWGAESLSDPNGFPNECGILMCLSQATGSPGVMASLPDVEAARQYWYDGAALICPGNQANDAPPPRLGP